MKAQSATLWDQIAPTFERIDPSLNKIVTRSAQRLIDRGFTVMAITPKPVAVRDFDWGTASDAHEVVSTWVIDFYSETGAGKIDFQGFLTVKQTVRNYVSRDPGDVPPAVTHYHEFLPDRRETAKKLAMRDPDEDWENGSGSAKARKPKLTNAERRALPPKKKKARRASRGRDWSAAVALYDKK